MLDNCEHLVEALRGGGCPPRLMSALGVLATSREPLGIPGEVQQLVSPSQCQTPAATDSGGTGKVRVGAFVRGAGSVPQRIFALTPQNAQAVARICERLEGIPLALELAAARVGLSEEQIASRLDDSLGLLTTGSRTAPAPPAVRSGGLDWSYELLGEPERALFGRLSVFAVGGRSRRQKRWVRERASRRVDLGPPLGSCGQIVGCGRGDGEGRRTLQGGSSRSGSTRASASKKGVR